MSTGPTIKRGKSESVVGTPWRFIYALEAKFGPVTFDLAATAENTKHSKFFSLADDSLKQDWKTCGTHPFLNPPFDRIEPWAAKADREGAPVSFLVPASVGTNWFRDHIYKKHLTIALNARIQFVGSTDPYPKDLMLVRFGSPWDFLMWKWTDEEVL